jgi:ketosteroid isomerase-like protein
VSQENVELVRQGYASWVAHRSLDFDLLDQDVEWNTATLLDGGVMLRGHDGVRDWFGRWPSGTARPSESRPTWTPPKPSKPWGWRSSPMSQENLSVVASAYEALTNSGVEAFSDYWSEDIEWRTMRDCWRGREAGRAYLQELVELFDDFTTEPIELTDAGNEQVVLYLRYGGRSKRGGMPVPPEYFAILIQVRNGKIAHALEYATRAEALAAAELRD